ncbi:AAA family ATPase [Candidatus Saccharibacteria bacterium]|nr:AAA family ATPase [Candidatus Saccharibacteria bacterium]
MNQALALEIMLSGESVMLTGPAGSGKTYVLNQYITRAKKQGKHVAVTATTGLAASHLGGSTIHAWSGIGVSDVLHPKFDEHLLKGRRDIIETTDVLIIDEISMLHDYRLDMVEEVARRVRKNDKPFGGIQVILCGDFFQLPPVNRTDSREGGFVVHSEAWEKLDPVICYLEEQHRQDDDIFLEILNALRSGDIRRRHAEALLERVGKPPADAAADVTELYTVNADVDRINQSRLDALETEGYKYTMTTTGKESYVETLKRSCLAPEELYIKKGALVMFIKNSPDRRYSNGTIGTVLDFEELTHFPIVRLLNGKKVSVGLDTWELRDGDKKRASLSQIPLRLAWAITVHKSQGMTLDAAKIDLRRAFVEGMGYVALSRVRTLQNLSLVGINNMALRVSQDALEIDDQFRSRASQDRKRFEHLIAKAEQRAQDEARRAEELEKRRAQGWSGHPGDDDDDLGEADPALLEALKTWRNTKASEASKPSYIIANNKTLQLIALRKPADDNELMKVNGMGPKKIELYGADILKIVEPFLTKG